MAPRVQYLILCDDVRTDPANPLRVDVLGVLGKLRPVGEKSESLRPPVCALLIMTECVGDGVLWLTIVRESDDCLVFAGPSRTVRSRAAPDEAVGLVFRVRDCPFPVAGRHRVDCHWSGRVIASQWFQVMGKDELWTP